MAMLDNFSNKIMREDFLSSLYSLIISFKIILVTEIVIIFLLQGCGANNNFTIKKTEYNKDYYNIIGLDLNETSIKLNSIYNIKVGVIDSGFDMDNPNLNLTLVSRKNEGDFTKYHGNIVSGIIGAKVNKHNKFSGIIPNMEIHIYDIQEKQLNIEVLISAIEEMIRKKIDIINISLSTTKPDEKLFNVVKNAIDTGITIVTSSGNSGNEDMLYPASFDLPGIISVGGINSSNNILSNSTFNDMVDVWAPGENIYSLGQKTENVKTYNGTSVSTPIVTSLAVLLKSKCQECMPKEIENLIKKGANKYNGKWKNQNKTIYLVDYSNTLDLLYN
jgi:subtilisin family serine protease